MIYEMRTYTLKPGTVPEFESRFAERHPYREKHSKLGGFWHTEFGPLNQVIHVWIYEDLNQRLAAREAANNDPDLQRIPGGREFVIEQESDIFMPAPFMRPMGGDQALGDLYEMRIYTYQPGAISKVIDSWKGSISAREKYSPLAAGMYSELGSLNKWVHIWPYKDLNERTRIRAEATSDPNWPPTPSTREFLVKQENKLLIPVAFSPMH